MCALCYDCLYTIFSCAIDAYVHFQSLFLSFFLNSAHMFECIISHSMAFEFLLSFIHFAHSSRHQSCGSSLQINSSTRKIPCVCCELVSLLFFFRLNFLFSCWIETFAFSIGLTAKRTAFRLNHFFYLYFFLVIRTHIKNIHYTDI